MTPPRLPPPDSGRSVDSGTALDLLPRRQLSLALDDETSARDATDTSIDLRDFLRLLAKRRWTILSLLLVFLAFSIVMTFLATPVYRASTTLQIDRATSRIVDLKETGPVENSNDSFDDFIQTQMEVLRSRSLAERVIEDMGLNKKTATRSKASDVPKLDASTTGASIKAFLRKLAGQMNVAAPNAEVTPDERRLTELAGAIQGSMNVELVRKSRLVRVSFDSTDPYFAQKAANAIAQSFIAMNLERRFEASAFAKKFLEDKLLQTKAKLEDSERDLVEFSREQGIINIDDRQSVYAQTLQEYNAAFSKAEQERIRAEVNYKQMEKDPYSLAYVQDNKNLQAFKQNKARFEGEYQDNLKIYKPAFPKMQQLQAQIAEAEAQIRQELDALRGAAYMSYQGALRQEALLREKLNEAKQQLLDLQGRSIRYGILKREVDTNRQLYDGLLQRFKEIGVAGGVGVNNISVVDKADLPFVPFSPNMRNSALTGMIIGLVIGLMVAWLLEYLDDSLKFPEEVERNTGFPVLGVIPRLKSDAKRTRNLALETHLNPNSAFAEAYRSVRTGLQFSTSHGAPKQLVVTSSNKGEGKSTTAISLAINFAQMGKPVLLIDADLRHPAIHRLLGLQNDFGLSNYLSSDVSEKEVELETAVPNLHVMTAGPMPPNPVELLSGNRFLHLLGEAGEGFAHIVVDSPPVVGISDAIVLGNQIDNMIFVVEAGRTRKAHVRSSLKRLRQAGVFPLGIILNKVRAVSDLYGYGGHHYDTANRPAIARDDAAG